MDSSLVNELQKIITYCEEEARYVVFIRERSDDLEHPAFKHSPYTYLQIAGMLKKCVEQQNETATNLP